MPFKIAYIDDESDLCEIFADQFASDGVAIRTFVDPAQAMAALEQDPADLIFLDYRLPGTTGDEIAQKMSSPVPKVLITGDMGVKTDYLFVKVFQKPYRADDIEKVIAEFRGRAPKAS